MRIILLLFTAMLAAAQTLPPATQAERLKWATYSSVGPPSLLAGVFTAALSTAQNSPEEYGPHWDGYGKRQLLRLPGAAVSNLMEAELGTLWGEDPRYRPSNLKGVKRRIWFAFKTSFQSYDRDGKLMPAYARFAAVPASNVIANSWRPDSQRTAGETTFRIGLGFLSRIAANTFSEFWPDVQGKMLGR
jgi:hypothetical protein